MKNLKFVLGDNDDDNFVFQGSIEVTETLAFQAMNCYLDEECEKGYDKVCDMITSNNNLPKNWYFMEGPKDE